MARRPSTVSLSSSVNSLGSLPKLARLPSITQSQSQTSKLSANGSPWLPNRTVSLNSRVDTVIEKSQKINGIDPDELFTKHTVAEVRAIQQTLRSDADAKQEELRLMVGERYRDLLQASTSIISIAQSSKNVLDALDEMRDVASSASASQAPRLPSSLGQDDAHLQTLQSLSAHMKLLLDAPEHLWRLIERKLYLHAAWLFLLSRVVHRALLRDEDDENTGWHAYDIDVAEQFPLVQRQWDAVAQFRSQITHKATISLREHTTSHANVCAVLLTLHLLESRPLPETMSILLAQRTKTLATMLTRSHDHIPNGNASQSSKATQKDSLPSRARKAITRSVRQKLEAVLELVSRTLGTVRSIFSGHEPEKPPLMLEVLHFIQADYSSSTSGLPPELMLTTQTLLTSLPSSTHFMLLPAEIRSYKPYVDSESASSSITPSRLSQKLDDWFRKATQDIRTSAENWFSDLHTIHEVWEVRSWIRQWVAKADGLEPHEKTHIDSILDDVSRQQVTAVWKSALVVAENTFREKLESALQEVRDQGEGSILDTHPVQYLLSVSPTLLLSQPGRSSSQATASFQKYRSSLQRQLVGRTPLLDSVLEDIERHAQWLRDDLNTMKGEDDNTRVLASQIIDSYRSDAGPWCNAVVAILQDTIESFSEPTEAIIRSIIFVGRVSAELSSSSRFLNSIGCDSETRSVLRDKTRALHELTIDRWRRYTVSQVVHAHWGSTATPQSPTALFEDENTYSPRPSSCLMDALLSLSSSMQQLGISSDSEKRRSLVEQTLHIFVQELLTTVDGDLISSRATAVQTFWDLKFLQQLALAWGTQGITSASLLDKRITGLCERLSSDGVPATKLEVGPKIIDSISRTQILFASFLPTPSAFPTSPPSSSKKGEKPSHLLRYGTPSVDAQYQPAVDLVKPSPRFGLLLVGSAGAR